MPKSNNNKSWPHQEFHDANKSNSKNNLIWDSRSYEYNNIGEIEKVNYSGDQEHMTVELLLQLTPQ
ncbi:hypothetical protein HET73_03885 [Wolbachia endosymbiont of Atemnus politus]|uniref:hypothetical protein n=1 Tax=Wolbachia endosymbiont of Atemnus politus TaxID=2682840 RepID=UPI0015728297|nr:hypothetical protein [Wolbachia endosymbiont of Atemnus politus]NSM56609.1 hypothetical protein [Wolbachia endosymbiont of Atemnus politus]NSX83115.1 hypothetical protein [Wolbachia endosymbiont of Atemnus politus]